ncbi:dihydrolipoyl dehydrogenase [Alicyclobacillus fastidiosus]|uniref:Dihydrolipoyl dehydrogenase n=1 Tax=Alicyclobacillus fastidiosus TaxID=392011 RepID=A0ABY6ZKK8_9BACL|nr:dihydrolipoyl dehydrogenase [Alicyclobacillus fastidiosus]WAH42425.1 dihydrolipoyl dehydrogenase [Alicyclobacillus fastidiosus]
MDRYDLTVIGGGSAGLTIASGAASFGARVALIEKDKMGGDCLNYGCVPTKALIRSATVAATVRQSEKYGIKISGLEVDFSAVVGRMRQVVNKIAEHDSPERFRSMGVDVLLGQAEFKNANELRIGDNTISSKKIVIATGSRAAVPPIPGLSETGFITNVEALQLDALPKSLVILGGGPIGLEFAQVFARLGASVTVIEMFPQLLPREDAEAAEIVRGSLVNEGIHFMLGSKVVQAKARENGKVVVVEKDGNQVEVACEEIFVATGRQPNVEIPGLHTIGIETGKTEIVVDSNLRTSVPHIFAAGDVKGGLQFTHVAGYEGKVVVRNTLFPIKQHVDYRFVPWTIYTDPEIAHVGLTEREARDRNGQVYVYTAPFQEVDRAVIDGEAEGFVKVVADKKGRIIGAHVVGEHAGELIQELVFAMHQQIPIGKISEVIHAYPTKVEGLRKAADMYWKERLFDGGMASMLKKISRFTR